MHMVSHITHTYRTHKTGAVMQGPGVRTHTHARTHMRARTHTHTHMVQLLVPDATPQAPHPPDAPMLGPGFFKVLARPPPSAPATYSTPKRSEPLTTSTWGPKVLRAWLLICRGGVWRDC